MSAQIFPFISPHRPSDAQAEAILFLHGRQQVTSQELVDHFERSGWAIGQRRAAQLLVGLGWIAGHVRRGTAVVRVYTRPSPIADGTWRRPWLQPVEMDPDLAASLERRRRWNLATNIFAIAACLWAIAMTVRPWL